MSFSIDALLSKDDTNRQKKDTSPPPVALSPSHSPHSDSSSDSRHSSPASTPSPGAGPSPRTPPGSSIVPRPGLLNLHHPALGATPALALPGLGPLYTGMQNGGSNSSAFHSPSAAEQAIKMAQMQQHLHIQDWMARSGMYLPRAVLDYNGECPCRHCVQCFSIRNNLWETHFMHVY